MAKLPITANDNSPEGLYPLTIVNTNLGAGMDFKAPKPARCREFARHARLTERPSMVLSRPVSSADYSPVWKPANAQSAQASPSPLSSKAYLIAALAWVSSIIANAAALIFAPSNSVHLLIIISAIWTSLAMVYIAQSRSQNTLAEMAGLAALTSFALALYVTSLRFGIATPPLAAAAIIAFACAAYGAITGSRLGLRIGAMLALAIAIQSVTLHSALGANYALSALTFLALIAALSYISAKRRDMAALTVSVAAVYVAVFGALMGLVSSGMISAVMATASLFTIGLAHSRLGALLKGLGYFGATIHANAGWIAMLAGLIASQDFWLTAQNPVSTTPWHMVQSHPAASLIWIGAIMGAAALIALLHLMRAGLNLRALIKGLFLGALAIGAAYASINTGNIITALSRYGISIAPLIGIALTGAAIATGIVMALDGFSRPSAPRIALGIFGTALATFIGLPALSSSLEAGALFVASTFICAITIARFTKSAKDNAIPSNAAMQQSANKPDDFTLRAIS
ncbi:MAG: hypothetical protein V3U82_07685 [Robiginitomaculum sp.]